MSANAAKLKKRAVELEQKKQFDKALALYIQFLQESDGALDDLDVPLYNRVGDLMLRTGNAADALSYYEKAVDLYAERGFLNNAIALCNKVLRQSPGRASIYYKLGKISATKGFKSDAKKNFLEYADRMQKAGQIDEAFRALKEFADLCPDQDDIRLMLAEQLTKENRHDEALEQLQKLHDKLDSEGRSAEARATVDRMKSIDPEAVPRVSGTYRAQKSPNLIFLDTSFEQASRGRQAEAPTPPPRAAAPPAGRQVSDPDLVILTLGDQPDAPASPVHNAAVADAFALDIAGLDAPNDEALDAQALPLLDVGGDVDMPSAAADLEQQVVIATVATPQDAPGIVSLDFDVAPDATVSIPPAAVVIETSEVTLTAETFAIDAQAAPAPVDLVLDQPTYDSGPPLSIDYAGDLHTSTDAPSETSLEDLFDFRAPPRSDNDVVVDASLASLDPDVSFPSFDLDDLPSADDITSGGSLAAALGATDTLGAGLDDLDLSTPDEPHAPEDATETIQIEALRIDAVAEPARVEAPTYELAAQSAASSADLDVDWPVATSVEPSAPAGDDLVEEFAMTDEPALAAHPAPTEAVETLDDAALPEIVEDIAEPVAIEAIAVIEGPAVEDNIETTVDVSVQDLVEESVLDATAELTRSEVSLDAAEASSLTPTPTDIEVQSLRLAVEASSQTPPTVAIEPDVHAEPEPERLAGWEVQRAHAERLLEAGDRGAGVEALEQVAVDLERIGDLERALTIVDELIRLTPDSIRHHQKRVELAFRSNHRAKLIDAYIELGDVLFRSGEERKARAVYQRVLELAPDDPRARAAVESVASMSPPNGSGAIAVIGSTPADARVPNPPARPHPRDGHMPYQPGPGAGPRQAGGIASPPPTRKPSPLDRSAASNGEFVDLGEWLRSGESPKSTRMVAEEKPPTGDEQADFQEMLKRFKQGVAENVEEEDYESHYDLGVAYKEMGLMDEAVAEFQKALRGTANRVRAYEALGQCFVEKEQYHVAASVLSRAIALGEGDDHHLVGVLYLLGQATEALSKYGDALDYYQRVFAVDIEFRDVAERISAIEGKAT